MEKSSHQSHAKQQRWSASQPHVKIVEVPEDQNERQHEREKRDPRKTSSSNDQVKS